jgi:hypothetical protein
MSRVSGKIKDSAEGRSESSDSQVSEDGEDLGEIDREETPDLYRNSALGMCVRVLDVFKHVLTFLINRYGGVSFF